MPAERREELLRWARDTNGYLIEDDYDSEYFFGEARSVTLQGADPERVILAGTTSKILAPGLRCGWLLVPEQLSERVSDVRDVTLSTVSSIDQAALAHIVASGGLDRHLRRTRRTYAARRAALLDALHRHMPELATAASGSGLHLYVPLREDLDEIAVAGRAQAAGAGVYAAGQVCSKTRREPALLLGFARLKAEDASAAIERVADAVRSDKPAPAPDW
jgi:GntR family transcriptional regulator/MocR family aminotransferase